MVKLASSRPFIKYYPDLLKGNIRAREALVYAVVAEFEQYGKKCFISRKELGKRINESEHSAERAVQILIKAGLLTSSRKGKLRYLSTNSIAPHLCAGDTDSTNHLCAGDTDGEIHLCAGDRDLCAGEPSSVRNGGGDLCAGDTLTRSITRSINKIYNQKETCDMPNQNFLNYWDKLSEQEKAEFVSLAARRLPKLKAKLAEGKEGMLKMLVLDEAYQGFLAEIEATEVL